MIERTHTPFAVVVVDIQKDFCPDGSLAVKRGDSVVKPTNEVTLVNRRAGGLNIFTGDKHPAKTSHFDGWPSHCIDGTPGADFHQDLVVDPSVDIVVFKGMDKDEDAYSGFDARDSQGNMLDDILKARGIKRLFVGGLATDYCVKATVLDGLRKDYEVFVMEDAVRAVNIKPEDGENAWKEMLDAGAVRISSSRAEMEILAMDAYEAGSNMGKVWREVHGVNEGNA